MSTLLKEYRRYEKNPTAEGFSLMLRLRNELISVISKAKDEAIKQIIDEAIATAETSAQKYIKTFDARIEKVIEETMESSRILRSTILKGNPGVDGKDADEQKIKSEILSAINIASLASREEVRQMITTSLKKSVRTDKEISDIVLPLIPDQEKLKDMIRQEIPATDFKKILENIDQKELAKIIARAIESLPYKEKLDYETGLKNKPGVPVFGKKTMVKGGGSSSSAGGFTKETPTGAVDSNNTIYTVTHEPNYVVADGATFFDGAGYTYAALTITMDNPPAQYIRSYY